MANIIYNIKEIDEGLIRKEDAQKVIDLINESIKDLACHIELAGGILSRGYSYNDIDLALVGERQTPCLCLTIAERLRKVEPNYLTTIFCEMCGASIGWRKTGIWSYIYDPKTANLHINWRKIRGARGGLSLFEYCALEERVKVLEEKSKAK